jgi:1-deoxy-D-xylulose-5-phosphate synthase
VMAKRLKVQVLNVGLPDNFIPQGTQTEIRHDLQLDAQGIEQQITHWLAQNS